MTHVGRWPHAMPRYTVGHLDRVAAIDRSVADLPGVELTGASYRGVGVPDCIAQARAAAGRTLEFLSRSRAEPEREVSIA